MGTKIHRVEYYHALVQDKPGQAYELLNRLQLVGVNLLAFNVVPVGVDRAQLILFPEDTGDLYQAANEANMELTGPHHALLVQGDDELGAFAQIHRKLFDAKINVYSSSGVTDGRGGYGYIVYVKAEDFERATDALGI